MASASCEFDSGNLQGSGFPNSEPDSRTTRDGFRSVRGRSSRFSRSTPVRGNPVNAGDTHGRDTGSPYIIITTADASRGCIVENQAVQITRMSREAYTLLAPQTPEEFSTCIFNNRMQSIADIIAIYLKDRSTLRVVSPENIYAAVGFICKNAEEARRISGLVAEIIEAARYIEINEVPKRVMRTFLFLQ